MRDTEEVDEALAEVDELKAAAARPARDVEADQRAEAHAIGVGEVGEVQDDAPALWDERADAGVQDVAGFNDESAVAAYGGSVADLLDFEGQAAGIYLIWHGRSPGRSISYGDTHSLLEAGIKLQTSSVHRLTGVESLP